MSYFPPVVDISNVSQDPEKNRTDILCSSRDARNADLSSGVMESSDGVDGSGVADNSRVPRYDAEDGDISGFMYHEVYEKTDIGRTNTK